MKIEVGTVKRFRAKSENLPETGSGGNLNSLDPSLSIHLWMFSSELFRKDNLIVWNRWSSPGKESCLFHQGSALPAEQLEHSAFAIMPSFILLLLILNTFLVLEKSWFVKWDPLTGDVVWRSNRTTAVPDRGEQGVKETLAAWEPDYLLGKPAAGFPSIASCWSLCFSECSLFTCLLFWSLQLTF